MKRVVLAVLCLLLLLPVWAQAQQVQSENVETVRVPIPERLTPADIQQLRQLLGRLYDEGAISPEQRQLVLQQIRSASSEQEIVSILQGVQNGSPEMQASQAPLADLIGLDYSNQVPQGPQLWQPFGRHDLGRDPLGPGFRSERELEEQASKPEFLQRLTGWGIPCAAEVQKALQDPNKHTIRPLPNYIYRNYGRHTVGKYEKYDPSRGRVLAADVAVSCADFPGLIFHYEVMDVCSNFVQPFGDMVFSVRPWAPQAEQQPVPQAPVQPQPAVPQAAPAPQAQPEMVPAPAPQLYCGDVIDMPEGEYKSGKKLTLRAKRADWRITRVGLFSGLQNRADWNQVYVQGYEKDGKWVVPLSGKGDKTILVDLSGPGNQFLTCPAQLQLKKGGIPKWVWITAAAVGTAAAIYFATRGGADKTSGLADGGGRGAVTQGSGLSVTLPAGQDSGMLGIINSSPN